MTHPFLTVATPLALQAAERITALRHTVLLKQRKEDHSLVTNADHASDRILREGLHAAFPDHAILTEESGLEGPATSEYVWVIDPLDGTKAYAKGDAGYSVMVGLLKAGKPFLGVVVDPVEGHVYEAVRGQGSWHTLDGQSRRLQVSNRSDLASMPVVTSTGFPEKAAQSLKTFLPGPWLPPINSVGIKVGLLVRQVGDIYINHHGVHYWDTCAPLVILEEAGGCMTFADGRPLSYALNGVYDHAIRTVATNNRVHADIVERVAKGMA